MRTLLSIFAFLLIHGATFSQKKKNDSTSTKTQLIILENNQKKLQNSIDSLFKKLKTEIHTKNDLSTSLQDKLIKTASQKAIDSFTKKLSANFDVDKKELVGTFRLIKDSLNTIKVYKQKGIRIDRSEQKDSLVKRKVNITKVLIEIRDGVLFNIKAFTDNPKEVFTNSSSTNIFSFDRNSKAILRSNLKSLNYIRLVDFLTYDYAVDKYYIIEKEYIKLSTHQDSINHKIFIQNNLRSFIDFRIYSDFLGLIDESANGIISFEGNSTFYLNPFNIARFNYLFKKFKAGVNYSRFDNDDRTIPITAIENNPLDMIQKSFLTAGTQLDIYETRIGKKFPYKILLKSKGNLFLTEVQENGSDTKENTTTLGLGIGAGIEVERFSNFGINASLYLNRYQNNNIIENQILNFNTFSIHSEAYFYTNNDKNDAFFLRLKYEEGRYNLHPSRNFFNIQFGYKAVINFNSKKE